MISGAQIITLGQPLAQLFQAEVPLLPETSGSAPVSPPLDTFVADGPPGSGGIDVMGGTGAGSGEKGAAAREGLKMLAADLEDFATRRKLAGEIPGLTGGLENDFSLGTVAKEKDGKFWIEFRPSGAATAHGVGTTKEVYEAYVEWRRRRNDNFFSTGPFAPEEERAEKDALETVLRGHGIQLSFERPMRPNQARYARAIFDLLPQKFLESGYIKEVVFGSSRIGMRGQAMYSAFGNGWVYLYSGLYISEVRNFMGFLLHELGHSTAARYALEATDLMSSRGHPPLPPDERIPLEVRQRMHDAYQTIKNDHVYQIDWADGRRARLPYTSSMFREFIAEFHLNYVVDSPGLRAHISTIENSAQRDAYRFIYDEIRDRIFGGKEYHHGERFLTIPPGASEILIGRNPKALGSPQLKLNDPEASRRHVRIFSVDGTFFIADIGSMNGTTILFASGGVRRITSSDGPVRLSPGDRIQIGNTWLTFPPGNG